jgi:adenylate cyclase
VLDLLRDHCGITETNIPEAISEKVSGSLQEMGLDPAQGTPYLLHLLRQPAEVEAVASLRPETVQARTFETLLQMSLRGSQQQSLILAIEDFQWIDPTSDDFLMALVEHLAGLPIFLLTTARPSAASVLAAELLCDSDRSGTPRAAGESAPGAHRLPHGAGPDSLGQMLLTQAEGNPLFLEDLMQGLVEQGVCVRTSAGRITLATPWHTRPLTAVQLPPTVQGA